MVVEYDTDLARDIFSRISRQSREDILSRLWSEDYWEFLLSLDQRKELYEFRRIVLHNNKPMLLMGVDVTLPGVGQTWCISTEQSFESAHLLVTEALKAQKILQSSGVFHRLYTLCNEKDKKSTRWLKLLGYVKEGVLIGHSKQGDDFSMWRLNNG